LIIGDGYIGLELAQAMRRFGSRVTIIERNVRLAHREDQDVTDVLHEVFYEEGIEVVTSARITRGRRKLR
jgi:pyruvate/2-oxoglutarate dehydrogenase complex dihydrolipoamide dehydrogenase (E3) component